MSADAAALHPSTSGAVAELQLLGEGHGFRGVSTSARG